MISHTYHCVFIHIPKTAGSSIEHKLGADITTRRNRQDHRSVRHIEPLGPNGYRELLRAGDWDTLYRRLKYALQAKSYLTPAQYQTYFKFTFVRNPWARVHSWYKNVLKDPLHQRELGVPPNCPFPVFVEKYLDCWALQPQLTWLYNHQYQITLDFIGRFENLDADFAIVAQRIGLKDAALPHLVRSGGRSYRQAYDDRSRDRVAQRYAEEIARFGYTFENG
ncbi:MAG: sulfotransferase family 2 domain-containing protein [Anaerolineales bacterium]